MIKMRLDFHLIQVLQSSALGNEDVVEHLRPSLALLARVHHSEMREQLLLGGLLPVLAAGHGVHDALSVGRDERVCLTVDLTWMRAR